MPTSRPPSVLVIGELNVDLVASGLVSPPVPGREVLAASFEMSLGSASAIFAHGMARLGHPVTFISQVGDDAFGRYCIDALCDANIGIDHVRRDPALQTGVTISFTGPNDRALVTYPGATAELDSNALPADLFEGPRHFHLASYFLQRKLRSAFPRLLARARAGHLSTSFDPNGDPDDEWEPAIWDVIAETEILFLNESESLRLTGAPSIDAAVDRLASVPCVVIKRGPAGASARRGSEVVSVGGFDVDTVDTTGAGDSFAAGFMHGYLAAMPLERCLELGNACGALSSLQLGGVAGQPDAASLDAFLTRARRRRTSEVRTEERQTAGDTAGACGTAPIDRFQAMVTATARVELPLGEFEPRSMLVTPVHEVERPKFPAIDYHNHLDAKDPGQVLAVMDACGIERLVNITMRTGHEALGTIARFHRAAPGRFATIAWMDWSDLHVTGFFDRSIERLERAVASGACGVKLWKDLGLHVRDANGRLLRIDDDRLAPLFEKARELGVPVMFHTADPDAFFQPLDRFNERYEELAAHPDWCVTDSAFSKPELLAQRDRVFARHPGTTFVAAHVAERPEHLASVSDLLARHANVYVDIGARVAELGRQPYTARRFFVTHADRILFGTDLEPDVHMYRLHFRFLETADEYFDYPSHASRQGRWKVYGLRLPDDVLEKVYRLNAIRLLRSA